MDRKEFLEKKMSKLLENFTKISPMSNKFVWLP